MNKKEILWIRELSCGHERPTNLAFMVGKFEKPTRGNECYCRICMNTVKIMRVRESSYNKLNQENDIKKDR